MSQPWSYFTSSGYYPYPYYNTYGYNVSVYNGSLPQSSAEQSSTASQIPQPPSSSDDSTPSSTVSSAPNIPPHLAYASYGIYMPNVVGMYSSDPAMDAAQRWNAMNCSYYGYYSAGNAGTPSPNTATISKSEIGPNGANNQSNSEMQSRAASASNNANIPNLYESGGGENKWSSELKDYVHRAFLSTETPVEKDQMERILHQKIEYVFRNSISVDWTKEPIPTIPTKCLAAINQSSGNKSSINVVRPVPLQPWRTRGRNAGALPTGTLVRNQQAPVLSGKADAVEKSNVMSSPLSSNNRTAEPLPASNFDKSGKRKRSIRQRSRSSSSSPSSSSSNFRNKSRPKRSPRKRSRSPVRHGNKRRKYRRESGTDSDHLTSDRTNSEPSDVSSIPESPKGRRGRCKGRNGGRKKQSPKKTPTSPKGRGGKRGLPNSGRGRGGKTSSQQKRWVAPDTTQHRLNQRADRFKDHLGAGFIAKSTKRLSLLASALESDPLAEKLEQFSIVGTMQELEKPYLRLTTAPDPANVRPLEVLRKALAHVKQRWKERSDYLWVCEQFKSIRQDLTVQRIQTELAAEVYEAHADIALEAGDSQEFHQCQSQLSLLHAEGLGSSRFVEFTSYRLLYYIFTEDLLGMSTLLASLTDAHKSDPVLRFALKVREAWALRNYKRFFQLACDPDDVVPFETKTSKMRGCRQILSWSIDRERKYALKAIFKTYRPSLSFDFITKTLGFENVSSCADFIIRELGVDAASVEDVTKADCKEIWSQMRQSCVADAVDR